MTRDQSPSTIDAAREALAASDPSPAELAPLLALAGERQLGLCPSCFAEVPASYPPFPAPLVVGPGRIAGEGYVVELTDSQWQRRLHIAVPDGVRLHRPDRRSIGPRGASTIAAFPFVVIAIVAAFFFPRRPISPFLVVLACAAVVLIVNALVASIWRPLPLLTTRTFDAAWAILARRLLGIAEAIPFLTRLAAASLGRGKPGVRANVLTAVQDWASHPSRLTDKSIVALRAAISVLQVDDAGRLGLDRIVGIADLVAPSFEGSASIVFAEYALTVFLNQSQPPTSGERARLRILLLGAAFEALLTPRDLYDLWAVAPHLKQAMAIEPSHRLGLLYGAWKSRGKSQVAGLETVYQFCRSAPILSAELTAANGDLLEILRTSAVVGPILVTGRGVLIGDHILASPKSTVELRRPGTPGEASFELVLGTHRIPLSARPEDGVVAAIRELLRFRQDVLMPYIEHYLETEGNQALELLVKPLSQPCQACGRRVAAASAAVGLEISETGD